MYKLTIIWTTGEKEEYTYSTQEKAKEIEKGYLTAFGQQIQFTCINRV